MTSVLYFHGFASSPNSQKVESIARLLGPELTLNAPDLNAPSFETLDFEEMMRVALAAGRTKPPAVVVGSSLGSIVALEAVRRGIDAPLVLIAPAIGIGDRWLRKIGPGDPIEVFNYARNANAMVHRAFFEQMAGVTPDAESPRTRVTIVMGRNDETVPFALVREKWEAWTASGGLVAGSKFIEIAGADHSLLRYVAEIAQQVRNVEQGAGT